MLIKVLVMDAILNIFKLEMLCSYVLHRNSSYGIICDDLCEDEIALLRS